MAALRREVEEFFALDEEFHHALLRLSGQRVGPWCKGHLDHARRLELQATAPPAFTDQHEEILGAVLAETSPRPERSRCASR